VSVNPITPDVFQGGQMTDLPVFSGTLDGTELMEIVAAPAGQTNEAAGVNYQITTSQLAALLSALSLHAVIIRTGQYSTIGNPYVPGPTISRIYVDKTIAEPTYISMNMASTYFVEPLVKDIAGTADALGNGITVTFTGGEVADTYATIPITTPFGGYFFRPIAAINSWTLGSA
jgi:predicted secreted protein